MAKFLEHREREAEWMDRPDADPDELRRSLIFIQRVNWLLGYTRATLAQFAAFSQSWHAGERIDIIDLATGSADIPLAILRWAKRRNFNIHIVAVDRHPTTAAIAAAAAGKESRLKIIQADVLDMPFAPETFDYSLSSMFLHHLSDDEATAELATMNRLARRGMILADLVRNRRAYRWIKLLTLASTKMVRHDAAVSVAQAFSKSEILAIAARARIDYLRYTSHFAHRFVLAGEKTNRPR